MDPTDRDREKAQILVGKRWAADGYDGLVNIPALVDAIADLLVHERAILTGIYRDVGWEPPAETP